MNLIVSGISMPLDHSINEVFSKALKVSGVSASNVSCISVYKKSVDARKSEIFIVYSVLISLAYKQKYNKSRFISETECYNYVPQVTRVLPSVKPVIIGSGPAGLFCSYLLSRCGIKSVVIERGSKTEERTEDVKRFFEKRILDTKSNIQFGEGGAGTFSDGKLVTRINDKRSSFVLETFVKFGAPEEILYLAKPHVGTDRLRNVIVNMRKYLIDDGVEFRFNTCMEEIEFKNGKVSGIVLSDGDKIETDTVFLAIGHSARDTYQMLRDCGIAMEKKAFSVGVRIEHKREFIDKGRYGKYYNHPELKSAEYQFSYRKGDYGCYTFCMCPGGVVVAAASEENTVVVNGMSNYDRDGENSNSAVVVSVLPGDLDADVLSGIRFQRKLERAAFELGGSNYAAPVQRVTDFINSERSVRLGKVFPSYPCGTENADMNLLFPSRISNMLKEGLMSFDKKLSGFSGQDGILSGVETRTSAPVRILRGADYQSISHSGLYPAGEGAGYAGGITSAAVDGIRVAEAYIAKFM